MPTERVERAVARVDLDAVRRNCAHLRSLLPAGGKLCAVVKADGYGHGAAPCARAALRGGAEWLAVAAAGEAADLRAQGLEGRILVMGALTTEEIGVAVEARADVVAWSERFVAELEPFAASAVQPVGVHVKLDTGMGRLGTKDPSEARAVADAVAKSDHFELTGVLTHFATADERGDEHFPAQLAAFERFVSDMKSDHPQVIAHAANSAATLREPAAHFDMVRCGVAIYGLDPFGGDPVASQLEPALSLESYVAEVKRFEPGDSAGYGRRWRSERPTWVGVLPIGYGDGVRRALTNNAEVLVGGRRYPLVGTVSMDNVTIDLGPETDVRPRQPAVLIGRQGDETILCEEVAERLQTINYEVTCGLLPRVRRDHRGG